MKMKVPKAGKRGFGRAALLSAALLPVAPEHALWPGARAFGVVFENPA